MSTAPVPPATPAPPVGDRIEEVATYHAPRSRVWRALIDPNELGAWFGVNLAGVTIAPGAHLRRNFTIPGHERAVFDVIIETVEPEVCFSWRWHPHAIDPDMDYSSEQRTLVEFTLEDTPSGGTRVRVVETGFDAVPEARRERAFRGNSGGWRSQMQERLAGYLTAR
ncbi:MAG: SRPBCC family protein [Gemmatimonadaceae bacterium]